MNTPLSPAADASRPAHGHHHDHSQNRPPKAFLIGCGLLILFALVGVSVAKFTGLGNFTGSSLVAAETRALSFADREDGGIQAFDPSTGVLVHEWAPGEGNFARTALRALAGGRPLGLLIDEKTTHGGVPVPTLGRALPADGAAVGQVARMAVAAGAAIVPFRVERLLGAHFRLTLYPAIDPPRTGDRAADTAAIVAAADAHLTAWVRERPEQWLWLSQRLSGRRLL